MPGDPIAASEEEPVTPSARRTLLAWFLAPAAASADWLVTRDGRALETEGPWAVDGDQVLFIAARPATVTVIGATSDRPPAPAPSASGLFALPIEEVDLELSRRETARRATGTIPSASTLEDPRDRKTGGPSISALPMEAPGTGLEARERWEESRPPAARWEVQAAIGASRWGNLRRAPEGEEGPAVGAGRAEGRLAWRPVHRLPLQGVVELAETRYRSLPSSSAYGLGLRYATRHHSIDVSSRFERDRRALEIGDSFEAADLLRHRARYSLRGRRLEWSLAGEHFTMEPDTGPSRGGHLEGIETAWLFRVFGRVFAPRLGVGWARWDAPGEGSDYGERSFGLELRFSPSRRFAFSLEGERRDRDYVTEDTGDGNFERRDLRHRWRAETEVLLTDTILARLSWDRLEGDSTRASRVFTAETLSAGLVLKMGATARPFEPRPEPVLPRIPPPTDLRGLDTRPLRDGVEARIVVGGPIGYRVTELSGPSRLVVDLVGVRSRVPFDVPVDTPAVARIRVAQISAGSHPLTRVTFLLNRPTVSEVVQYGDDLVVRLAGDGG